MMRWLDEVEVQVRVNVVLVGFAEKGGGGSEGEGFVELDAATLQRHLDDKLVRGLSADSNGGVPIAVVRPVNFLSPARALRTHATVVQAYIVGGFSEQDKLA